MKKTFFERILLAGERRHIVFWRKPQEVSSKPVETAIDEKDRVDSSNVGLPSSSITIAESWSSTLSLTGEVLTSKVTETASVVYETSFEVAETAISALNSPTAHVVYRTGARVAKGLALLAVHKVMNQTILGQAGTVLFNEIGTAYQELTGVDPETNANLSTQEETLDEPPQHTQSA